MTLIVGVLCEDGIVVSSDGAATFSTGQGQETIRQDVRKLRIIQSSVIVSVSGPVGLGQRFESEIEDLWKEKAFSGKKPEVAMVIVREKLWKHIEPEMQVASVARGVVGGLAGLSALTHSVVALPVSKEMCLFQFDQQGAPERATRDLPFVSVGSGQPTADPFLAFLREILWPERLPSVGEGVLASCWTLLHAIKTMPGGVSEPIQVAVLERVDDRYLARELADQDLLEPREFIDSAKKELGNYLRRKMQVPGMGEPPEDDEVIPEVPKPPITSR